MRQLNTDIRAWIDTWNDNPRPYVWTKTADQILESIGNYCTRINDSDTSGYTAATEGELMPRMLARIRVPFFVVGVLCVLLSPFHHLEWVAWLGTVLILLSLATTFMPGGGVKCEPTTVEVPVRGRWIAINSPADKVPSHGVHSAGQTYAIDLVYWPDTTVAWKAVQRRPLCRRAETFPGFGQPVFAPAAGTVVRTRDRWRDHWSRNSWPALMYLMVEASIRELLGPGVLFGNHIVIDLGDGTYAALAHLKRRSITVAEGQQVNPGQELAACGNSGNSSEPHLHFQLMDSQRVAYAAGLPFALADPIFRRTATHYVLRAPRIRAAAASSSGLYRSGGTWGDPRRYRSGIIDCDRGAMIRQLNHR